MAHVRDLFQFLKEYNEIQNPVVLELNKQKWYMEVADFPDIDEIRSVFQTLDFENEVIFEIRRPNLRPCPAPGEVISEWVERGWRDISAIDASHKEKIERISINDEGQEILSVELFEDDSSRTEVMADWVRLRAAWRVEELPKNKGLRIYNELFETYASIKKEAESIELILGDGIITWNCGRVINHPVLLQKVVLEFNPDVPSFVVRLEDSKPELYTSLLREIPTTEQSLVAEVTTEVDEKLYHLADISNTTKFFERLIHVVDQKGILDGGPSTESNVPQIKSSPVLFLRKRSQGYSSFIQSIIDDIEKHPEKKLPDFFGTIVGQHIDKPREIIEGESWNVNGIDEDILLTLPANNEQLNIIKYLNHYGAVLVQGPPGTGKTHTIANLIGHLLSEGANILVTSHTEKALSVLKQKVYEPLQSLCISLLSSTSQKDEMDGAINAIASQNATLDLNACDNRINKLVAERKRLVANLRSLNSDLLKIRAEEYIDIVYNGQNIKPVDAAVFIHAGIGKYDYLSGSTSDNTVGLPLSLDELNFLYASNDRITHEEETLLGQQLPDLDAYLSPVMFSEIVSEQLQIGKEIKGRTSLIDFAKNADVELISAIMGICSDILLDIEAMEPFEKSIVRRTFQDGLYRSFWSGISEEIDGLLKQYETYRKVIFEKEFDYHDELISEDSLVVIREIVQMGSDRPFNMFTQLTKPKWVKVRNMVTNNGKQLEGKAEFEALELLVRYELERKRIVIRINKLLTDVESDTLAEEDAFEERTTRYRERIRQALAWKENGYEKKIAEFLACCSNKERIEKIVEPNYDNPIDSIQKSISEIILPELRLRQALLRNEELQAAIEQNTSRLESARKYGYVYSSLMDCALERDVEGYRTAFEVIESIYNKNEIAVRRKALIKRIHDVCKEWANDLMYRRGMHGEVNVPDNIENAWKWIQLNNQINQILESDGIQLEKKSVSINKSLLENSRELAVEKAWYERIKRSTDRQNQALRGWVDTNKRLGKGKGKRVPMFLKEMRRLMPECQSAIPVWIMPLSRVAENFDPQKNLFDVVIIDEASQADILSFSALYLGKRIIVVGDDEQVSPESVGVDTDKILALQKQYLQEIPNGFLYDEKQSLYNIAAISGFRHLMLTEHFRCLPEIIEFSNRMSYGGRIKPLRDASHVTISPPVVEYRVSNGFKLPNKVNENEALSIASLVCACCETEEYSGKTIGVISLLGNEQSLEIQKHLLRRMDSVAYESRRIQCGTPPHFQGDERDVIFLSIVESPSIGGGTVRKVSEDGNNDIARKRYNVAASRAKDQLWVVHSLNPEIDLKPDDIRLRLINHALDSSVTRDAVKLDLSESDFEYKVMKSLLDCGYKIHPQWNVGSYRIDMVIEDGDRRVALECDGERWHGLDKLSEDMKRQAILERIGWKFIRIRGSAYYRNPEEEMERVYSELSSYGIRPNYQSEGNSATQSDCELRAKVIRKAEEILRSWQNDEDLVEDEEIHFAEKTGEPDRQLNKLVTVDHVVSTVEIDEDITGMSGSPEDILLNSAQVTSTSTETMNSNGFSNDHNANIPAFDFRDRQTSNLNVETNGSRQVIKNPTSGIDPRIPLFDFRKKDKEDTI